MPKEDGGMIVIRRIGCILFVDFRQPSSLEDDYAHGEALMRIDSGILFSVMFLGFVYPNGFR